MPYPASLPEGSKVTAQELIKDLEPVFVALLKRRTAGGLVADLTREGGEVVTATFSAEAVARLSDTVNGSPQGVLDPRFIGEVTDTLRESFGVRKGL